MNGEQMGTSVRGGTRQVSEQPVLMALGLAAHQGSRRIKKRYVQTLRVVISLRRPQEA